MPIELHSGACIDSLRRMSTHSDELWTSEGTPGSRPEDLDHIAALEAQLLEMQQCLEATSIGQVHDQEASTSLGAEQHSSRPSSRESQELPAVPQGRVAVEAPFDPN